MVIHIIYHSEGEDIGVLRSNFLFEQEIKDDCNSFTRSTIHDALTVIYEIDVPYRGRFTVAKAIRSG